MKDDFSPAGLGSMSLAGWFDVHSRASTNLNATPGRAIRRSVRPAPAVGSRAPKVLRS
jgi:hypothetical protein